MGERDANRVIEEQLEERVRTLESASGSDVLFYSGLIYPMASEMFKDALEALPDKTNGILVLLETTGGLIHVAERIAKILRHHYRRVAFLVPSEALSAGTILVMSGDSIYMDYASMLGPIDPQIRTSSGNWVPALGYLEQYERMVQKADEGRLNSAELAYMIENFDPAELYQYEQEKELSIALLEEWLAKYKFKNWKRTESEGTKVTAQMRRERAADIALKLNDTNRWHSHSRGIPIEVLQRDLKLLIDDLGPMMRSGRQSRATTISSRTTASSEEIRSSYTRGSDTLAGEDRFKTNATAIAAKNPKVDLKVVKEARGYIAERRAGGRQRRGYTLSSPHAKSL